MHRCLVAGLIIITACGSAKPAAKGTHVTPPGKSTGPAKSAVIPPADPTPPALRLPDDVVPTAYRVTWAVDSGKPDFSGHVDIDVNVARATDHVWLDAVGLAITAPSYSQGGADRPLTAIATRTDDVVGFRFAAQLPPGPA